MRILLIVNADDFGLAPEVNQAVAQGFDRGLVRSASLLTGTEHAQDAAAIAAARPGLGVGVHLALTQVKPVLPPERIPGLASGGAFPTGPRQLIGRLAAGRIPADEMRAEWTAQIEKALSLGVRVTHLDGHQHLHVLPGVARIFREVAEKFGIRAMRLPRLGGPSRSPQEWLKALAIHGAQRLTQPVLRGMKRPDRFWGLACSGDLTRERITAVFNALAPGTHELMTHPATEDMTTSRGYAWGYHWPTELAALCDLEVLDLAKRRGIDLGNFGDLTANQ